MWLFGRKYCFLWSKQHNSHQDYVLFAEKGSYICKDQEMSADHVYNWCFPKCNQNLTPEEEYESMEINFSKTTACGLVCKKSLEFVNNGISYPCGLISRRMIDEIWKQCKRSIKEHATDDSDDSSWLGTRVFSLRFGG